MKYNHKAINAAEQSFRDLVQADFFERYKKKFIHDFKNLCHHSCINNLFDHYIAKPYAKVNMVKESVLITDTYIDYMSDAVAIELVATRKGVRRAFLMISISDYKKDACKVELHVYYYQVGKVVYPVKVGNLHNTMLVAIS